MCLSRLRAALALPCVTLLTACSSSLVPVAPKPDASLMQPCERPKGVDINATDNEIALAWLDAVEKYLLCERKQEDLAKFVKGMP
jgi:hypothetical protein